MLMSDLVTEIIGEIGGDSADTALQTKIFSLMKAGMRIIPALVRSRVLVTRGSFVLVTNANSYDLTLLTPAFIREREFSYVDVNGKEVPIYPLSVDMFIQQKDPNAIGSYPKYFNIANKTVYFDRSAPSNLTIKIDYFGGLTTSLVAGSTYFSSEDTMEMVKFLTKAYYYEYQEDDTKHDRNMGKAKILMDELESRYIEDELGGFPDET